MTQSGTAAWIGRVVNTDIVDLYDADHAITLTEQGFETGDIVLVMRQAPAPVTIVAKKGSCLERTYTVLARNGINPEHSVAALEEAGRFQSTKFCNDPTLRDLTDLNFVTIDNEDSRDLDQALLVEHKSDGGFVVHYALADAAWFVRPGSALFEEALQRGVTYYAPQFSASMLPDILSQDLISLNPNELRRALVFHIKLDSQGTVLNTDVSRAKVQSRAKLSYSQVQEFFDATANNLPHPLAKANYARSLLALKSVGILRLEDSRFRDVVEVDRREAQVIIADQRQHRFSIEVRARLASEKYNEQISLLCNMEGARLLNKLGRSTADMQSIFRVHLPPLKTRIKKFREQLDQVINAQSLDESWYWHKETSLADYLAGLPKDEQTSRVKRCIERLILRTNRASTFEEVSDQHYALGVDSYARFSSPMREIVGIFTHKELYEALEFDPLGDPEEDVRIRNSVIAMANTAKSTQRALEKAFQLEAIKDFLNHDLALPIEKRSWYPATVFTIEKNRIIVNLDEIALDLKLYTADLEDQFGCTYTVDSIQITPSNSKGVKLKLADCVRIRTRTWDEKRQRFLFDVASSF